MKGLMLLLFVALSLLSLGVAAEPKNVTCMHSVGPPGNWCPKCSQYPNYLLARRVEPVEGPCLRCYLGCAIATAVPGTLPGATDDSSAICHRVPEISLSDLDKDSLVSLQIDPGELQRMAETYPIAAAMIAVLHANGDPLPVLDRLNEFQIQFRDRPVAESASDYLTQSYPAAREDLPDDSDVLTTAKSSQIDADTVLLEVQSELRSAKGSNLVIEGPVMVQLRATGRHAEVAYGGTTLRPRVMAVIEASGLLNSN